MTQEEQRKIQQTALNTHGIIQASTGIKWSLGGFSSHDKAVEEGIKYALEVLI